MDVALIDRVLVRMVGPGSSRTLHFIHGFADRGSAFTPLFDTPLAERFRLVAVDLPGFGASPRRDDVLTIAQHAEAVAGLARSVSSFTLIGLVAHSVGSMIAVEAAVRLGERFGGLFSIEGNLTGADAYFSGRAADFDDPHIFKQRFLDDLWDMSQAEPILRRYHGAVTMADPMAMWSLGRDARRLSLGDAPGQAYLRVRPSLYYWSRATTTAATREWIAANDIAQHEFAGGSHWPTVDQPREVAHVMASFFEQV